MRYSVEWCDGAENASLGERATIADFAVWLGDQPAMLHMLGDEIQNRDRVRVALCHLAEGLAHDWWSIFGGRDREVQLLKFRSGFILPDIRLRYDGAAFEISAHQRVYYNPPVRFWDGGDEVLSRQEAETQLGGLISDIVGRLAAKNLQGTSAALRWSRVQASREDADETEFCEAAGALGLDPYQIDEASTDIIENAAARFRGEPLNELLAGIRGADARLMLDWVEAVEGRRPYCARVPELRDVALKTAALAPARPGESGWARGYRRAGAARTVLAVRDADRFIGFRSLAAKLGASRSYQVAKGVDGLRALRSDRPDAVYLHMRTHGQAAHSMTAHAFTFARGVGDVICFPVETRAPVNDLQSAYRQAAGRAFAAQFLAPIDEIRSMREDGRDVVSMAEEFGVSAAVIERQLENEHRIDEALAA